MNLSGLPFDMALLVGIVKAAYLLGLSIYVVFGLVMIRQVGSMTKTVQGPLSLPLLLAAWIHLGLSAILFVLALFVL